jgi:hypothetical protein
MEAQQGCVSPQGENLAADDGRRSYTIRIKVNASAMGMYKCKIWFKTIENRALMNIM